MQFNSTKEYQEWLSEQLNKAKPVAKKSPVKPKQVIKD